MMNTDPRAGLFGPTFRHVPGRRPVLLVLSLLVLSLSPSSHAAPGDLDPSFNPDGIPGFDLIDLASAPDEANAVVTQPDGKIVVAGYAEIGGDDDFALIRYNPDGNLDSSFGGDGIVSTDFGGVGSNERANSLVRQVDGKLVAAGFTDVDGDIDLALVRYNIDGSFDNLACCLFLGNDVVRALVLQPDGRLVAAGFTDKDGDLDVALVRFNPDGSLDNSFGVDGRACCFYFGNDAAHAVDLQRDGTGRLVVAGFTDVSGSHDFVVARLNQDGSLDRTLFGGGTRISIGTNRQDEANALVLQPDGRLVTSGFSSDGTESALALLRLNADGVLDTTFGFGGGVLTSFGPGSISEARALVLQPDGKLIEGGTALVDGDIDFALVRHNSDGSLDPSFGFGGGTLTLLNVGSADLAFALAAQPDGKLVAAGTSIIPGDPVAFNFAVARYEVGPIGLSGLSERSERLSSRALTPGSMSCNGQPVTILGTPGDDMLRGTNDVDVIHGMAGNDSIFSFDGNDIICGGAGKDRLIGGVGNDRLFGQGAADRLFGEAGRDKLDGGGARDVCNAGKGGKRDPKRCEKIIGGRPPDSPTPPPSKRFRLSTIAGGVSNVPPSLRSRAGTGSWEIHGLDDQMK